MKRGFEVISQEQLLDDGVPVGRGEIQLPKRGTSKSAGYDFFLLSDLQLEPKQIVKLPTGIKAYMQDDEVLKIAIRSSLGFKYNVRLVNQLGVIDADYYNNKGNEGHIWVKVKNEGKKTVILKKGEAIAQGIFQKYLLVDGDGFEGSERNGGIGSTNK